MASSDRRAVRAANIGVGLVAATAAVISFSHVRAVAVRSGESDLTSWLLPVSIDGAVVAAVSVLLVDSRAGRRSATLTWLLLGLGLSASLAANVASAEPTGTARAVAAWPPIALALGIEVLAGLARRCQPAAEADAGCSTNHGPAGLVPGSGSWVPTSNGRAAATGSRLVPMSLAVDAVGSRSNGQPALDDAAAITVIRQLDRSDPTGRASRLEIQKTLGCGGSRAARLAELARK